MTRSDPTSDNNLEVDRCCRDTARHRELHRCLDELVACWISDHAHVPLSDPDSAAAPKLPSNSTIMELMQWSALKARGQTT